MSLRLHKALNVALLALLVVSLLMPGVRGQGGISSGWANRLKAGPTVPSSCVEAAGHVFFKTTGTDAQKGIYNCINNVFVKAGGAGVTQGSNLVILNPATTTTTGWNNFTIFTCIRGRALLNMPASWVFNLKIATATLHINKAAVWRTALDSNVGSAITDATTITWSGNGAPTLPIGTTASDPISLQLDATHDYWIAIYINSDSGTSAIHTHSATVPLNMTDLTGAKGGDQVTGATVIPNRDNTLNPFLEKVLSN